jgi:AcrR family transcriptional regulator
MLSMPRPKEFDEQQVLDAAIDVFREHGYEGSSAEMLVAAMGVGRQSLYDTFGDKWRLYCSSLRRYVAAQTEAHIVALSSKARAVDGIKELIERVIADAAPCLGVSSVCEFGRSRGELLKIRHAAAQTIQRAIAARVSEGQAAGDIASELDSLEVARFVYTNIAAIRLAKRGGADSKQLRALGRMVMRALR